MNFLAHCFLAQPNQYSLHGNLLGDFIAGADLENLPEAVILGLENHKFVDRFTDAHQSLPKLKILLTDERKRFSGIMADVVFDYFLIKHWQAFSQDDLRKFVELVYSEIRLALSNMHPRMVRSMKFMLDNDGLMFNHDLQGVGVTLDRLSNRIRFENNLSGGVEEIKQHYDAYEQAFMHLFPELVAAVKEAAIETKN